MDYYSVHEYIRCIDILQLPYPAEALSNFLDSYISKFTRETDVSNIYFDGISQVEIEHVEGAEMTDADIEEMLLSLIRFHPKSSTIHKKYAEAIKILRSNIVDVEVASDTPPKKTSKRKAKTLPKKENLDEASTENVIAEINENIPPETPKITLEDAVKILIASNLPVNALTKENETKFFVADVWLVKNGQVPDLDNALWPYSDIFAAPIENPGEYIKTVVDKISGNAETNERFEKIIIRPPSLPVPQRWEIGISGNPQSVGKVHEFVKTLPGIFSEIYMIKLLKPKYANRSSCSKAEVYLEISVDDSLQSYLDRIHEILPKELAKMIMPKSCADKPKFMTNIPAILKSLGNDSHPNECIFTFSQGGEEGYEYKSGLTNSDLKTEFDGDSFYKAFGTLDVGIDARAHKLTTEIVEKGAEIIKDLEGIGREVFVQEFGGYVDVTRGFFTELLFTFNISMADLMTLGERKSIKYLWGIDSQNGELIFVMKPEFYLRSALAVAAKFVETSGGKQKGEVHDPYFKGVMAAETAWFTYRNPRPPGSELFCVNKDKPNYTWCNLSLEIDKPFDVYDVDVVLVPRVVGGEIMDLFSDGPLRNRVVLYEDENVGVVDANAEVAKGTRRRKETPSLSFHAFVDAQKEYMKRLLYYGLFKNAVHSFL